MKIMKKTPSIVLQEKLKTSHKDVKEAYDNFAESYKKYKVKEYELLILRDKLGIDMRNNPEDWGLEKGEKITDALINRVIVRNSKYKKIYTEFIELKKERMIAEGMVESAKVKAYSLIELFKLER